MLSRFQRRFLRSLFLGWGVIGAIAIAGVLGGDNPNKVLISVGIAVVALAFCAGSASSQTEDEMLDASARGRKLKTFDLVRKETKSLLTDNDPGILWGKIRIPTSEARHHFCVVGVVGSGKTLTLRMLMKDQLPLIVPGSDRRALIYDSKQDMVGIVSSLNLKCPIVILNPFDKRGYGWKMAADIDTPALARQLADTLVPDQSESQPFFSNAARELLTAVVTALIIKQPGTWTFRQVLLIMKSKRLLQALLGKDPRFSATVQNFLQCGDVTLGSIMATIASKLGPYEAIAAAWEKSSRQISISKWLKHEGVIILGNDEKMRSSLDTVNQLIVSVIAQNALSMSESATRMTWLFFDEFREAGKLDGLPKLIMRGRSKGCCVVLGFQDIQGVRDVYGDNVGDELVGQCGNKALLRIESPTTAEWASKSVGEKEQLEVNVSNTSSSGGGSSTTAYQRHQRAEVLPSQFMEIETTSQQNGLTGYYLIRTVGAYKATYAPQEINELIGTIDPNIPNAVPCPVDWQYLEPWSTADSLALHIDPGSDDPDDDDPNLGGIGRLGQ